MLKPSSMHRPKEAIVKVLHEICPYLDVAD